MKLFDSITLSELITKLKEIHDDFGDLPVYYPEFFHGEPFGINKEEIRVVDHMGKKKQDVAEFKACFVWIHD